MARDNSNGPRRSKTATDGAPFPDDPTGDLGPPAPRGRPRRPGRGLPTEEALLDLARTYLQTQRTRWPELTQNGMLPEPDDSVLAEMVEQFRSQFLSGKVIAYVSPIPKPPWEAEAGSYLRYSDANSNPRSLDQQLKIQLERARSNGHFIPWCYVFADAAVTGTTADRHGYDLAKMSLGLEGMKCLYIDEIGRASRDAIESLRLGRLIVETKKRLIGVSDGFDSIAEWSKLQLSMFAMLQEWFVDQLRSKVNRGMDDAFGRKTNIFAPAVGYKLEPAVDDQGRPLLAQDGDQANAKVIEEEESKWVLWAFEKYGRGGWSKPRIARKFNSKTVGGLTSWDGTSIDQLLRRYTYVGIEIYRRTYHVKDPVTGKRTTVERPRKEWKVRRIRSLQIVPWGLWKVVKKRLAMCRDAYTRKMDRADGAATRADVYPKVLVRPICKSCGTALILGQSGKYPSFCCHNGVARKNGCQLRGYKSVRIVEGAVMAALHARILQPKFIERALAEANAYLVEESTRPREQTGPLEAEIRTTLTERDRLVKILDKSEEDELPGVVASLKQKERLLKELRGQLAEARARNEPPPPPMTLTDVEGMLADLRGLLSGDVAVAAPLLRDLTGPVVVEQIREEGDATIKEVEPTTIEQDDPGREDDDAIEKRRPATIWVAEFKVDAVALLARLTASKNCPTTSIWEYLKKRGWTMGETVVVRAQSMSIPQQFATDIAAMVAKGASINSMSRALGLAWETVRAAVDGDEIDESIGSVPSIRTAGEDLSKLPLYMQIAEDVAQQRDKDRRKFREIAQELEVSPGTVTRAYDLFHKVSLVAAVSEGHAPDRGRIPHLGEAKHQDIVRLIKEGRSAAKIAKEVGCSKQTVYRERKTLKGDLGPSKIERTADEPEQCLDEGCNHDDNVNLCCDVIAGQGLNRVEGLAAGKDENCSGKRPRLGAEKLRELAQLLEAGCDPGTIATKVGCGIATVYRKRRTSELDRSNKPLGRDASESAAADGCRMPSVVALQQTFWVDE